ncbi:restriction endonuclease fold toxin-2 domain-containing protein [Kitasatospora sp. NRRL B-11411]|uniref:restriction endonuclease fold toxin-2 domain-containing protein n=1 Tax=Kitasatospora sp. NRRL B-11411 TaxID=1463822 RepID=UPI0004C4633F|nr:restriction endonuclease fold toxin-2 domain-containing protein [Kitasatospora sp. NRRL B-11411]
MRAQRGAQQPAHGDRVKEVHEIPVIGKFWPQGDPDRLRQAGEVRAKCASLLDDAQANAGIHAANVVEYCQGKAFDAFQQYAATVYTARPHGGNDTSPSLPLMENLSASCRQMHALCTQYADAIDTCRNTLIGLGTAAGIITTAGVILTFFTFGGSDVVAGAADAALVADAAAAEALAAAEAEPTAAAAVAEAEAVVASLAARLSLTLGAAAAVTAATGIDSASATTPPGPVNPLAVPGVGPVSAPVPHPYRMYTPAEQFGASTWAAGLPQRQPNYGTADDRAYQVRVVGTPELLMSGANGETVWADGFRPSDGAIIDAKNVRKQGCSPRSLQGLQEGKFNTNLLLAKDESELSRYQAAIDDPANHAQYLEADTPDPATVGYWQFLLAANHVKSNVRVVP